MFDEQGRPATYTANRIQGGSGRVAFSSYPRERLSKGTPFGGEKYGSESQENQGESQPIAESFLN